jgi:hypothetical protein
MRGLAGSGFGRLSCQASEGPVELAIDAGVTRGMGSPLFSFQASAGIDNERVPADMRRITFSRANVAQYWLHGKNLGLVLYREREGGSDHAEITITVQAESADGSAYDGQYRAAVHDVATGGDPIELAGDVTCQVE